MRREFEQTGAPYDASECLELMAYEALARRNAIVRRLQAELGHDLEFRIDLVSAADVVELHRALLKETTRCVGIMHDLEAAKHKASGVPDGMTSRDSDAARY